MSYILESVTLTGDTRIPGFAGTEELWHDIVSGRIPLLFDSGHQFQEGLSPVTKYSHYTNEDRGTCMVSVLTVRSDFFARMDRRTEEGAYKKYAFHADGKDMSAASEGAWRRMHEDVLRGRIVRAFKEDWESVVPARYTPDQKAYCCLYISVRQPEEEQEMIL